MIAQADIAPKNHRFTKETARAMGIKSALARAAKREQAAKQPEPVPFEAGEGETAFVEERLRNTRAVLVSLDTRLAKETEKGDAGNVAKLARAIAALSETERVLSGRPSPGALRPKPKLPKVANTFKDRIAIFDPAKLQAAASEVLRLRKPQEQLDAIEVPPPRPARAFIDRNEPLPPIGPLDVA